MRQQLSPSLPPIVMSAQADYFALFDLPRRYEIERPALESAYERLTLAHHPDFFSTAPPAQKQEAERTSAVLNEGYRVLVDDLARADYLLELLAAGRGLNAQELPQGFLQEMFMLQEEVDDLEHGAFADRREALIGETEGRLSEILTERGRLFAAAGAGGDLSLLQTIQTNLNCERYIRRLLDRLNGAPAP